MELSKGKTPCKVCVAKRVHENSIVAYTGHIEKPCGVIRQKTAMSADAFQKGPEFADIE